MKSNNKKTEHLVFGLLFIKFIKYYYPLLNAAAPETISDNSVVIAA